ncbi:HD domain-containing protein [bacterium]|nr:HD domain-containing protein [bacterium]
MNNNDTSNKKIMELESDLEKFTMELSSTYEELSLIYEITNEMETLLDPEVLSSQVLDKAVKLLKVRIGFLMLFEDENKLILKASKGFGLGEPERFNKYNPFKGIVGMAISQGKPVIWCDASDKEEARLGIKSCLAVPILVRAEKIGVICLGDKTSGESFYSSDEKLIFTLAIHVGAIFANSRLHHRIESLLFDTVKALVSAIEQKDPYTKGHSERVAEISEAIADEMAMTNEEKQRVKISGILHDVGKIGIPASILIKLEKLDYEEWEKISEHPIKSVSIIKNIEELKKILPSIYHHHERYGGGGYPDGISGEQIPLIARIIAVTDTFDAMNSNRAYRSKLNLEEILREIKDKSGSQFDPRVVQYFFFAFDKGKVKVE